MLINPMILIQTAVAMLIGLGFWYLQKHLGGPFGGITPGVLGFVLGWLIAPAVLADINQLRRWLLTRRSSTELEPK